MTRKHVRLAFNFQGGNGFGMCILLRPTICLTGWSSSQCWNDRYILAQSGVACGTGTKKEGEESEHQQQPKTKRASNEDVYIYMSR